jgi:hypothetical protein
VSIQPSLLVAKHIGTGAKIPYRVKQGKFQTETLPKFGNLLWPGLVEVQPGETTRLRVGRLDIKSKLSMYVRVIDKQGQEILETSSRRIALPPGSYVLEIDSRKFFKSLTDEQRKIPVELNGNEVLAVPVD